MTDAPDADLLEQFTRNDSEAAFAALVQRHLGLVHSVALRHTASPQHAQDITQAVFIILARKAGSLGHKTILPGWLYHTARLTAANWQRAETRRIRREQEAFMQSTLEEPAPDAVWLELSTHLDDAMAHLGVTDRDALVLRYFQNKSLPEVGATLGIEERAAQKRVVRALDKLRKMFNQRGITLSAVTIASAVSANSVSAAPIGLAKTISAVAVAKGTVAGGSTLTLVKGALKIMAWTKAKTAIVATAGLVLAIGTSTVVLKTIRNHSVGNLPASNTSVDDSFFVNDSQKIFSLSPNILIFRKSHFSTDRANMTANRGGFGQKQECRMVFAGLDLRNTLARVYEISPIRVMLPSNAPTGRFDGLVTLPASSQEQQNKRFQGEISRQLGLVAHKEKRQMDVLLLKLKYPNAPGFTPHTGSSSSVDSKSGKTYLKGQTVDVLADFTEFALKQIVEDHTGLNGSFDYVLDEKLFDGKSDQADIEKVLLDQFGLELVPSRGPVEMLVVEKAKN